jgi:hypothetical protein
VETSKRILEAESMVKFEVERMETSIKNNETKLKQHSLDITRNQEELTNAFTQMTETSDKIEGYRFDSIKHTEESYKKLKVKV